MGHEKFTEPITIALCVTLVAVSKKNRERDAHSSSTAGSVLRKR